MDTETKAAMEAITNVDLTMMIYRKRRLWVIKKKEIHTFYLRMILFILNPGVCSAKYSNESN
jgi:hypothetical protein